jgi:hypothetical protein
MHATIALCLMLTGGPVAPGPEPEIVFVPLKDDLTSLNAMQELEWKTRLKRGYKLPRVPSVDDQSSNGGDGRGMRQRYTAPTDPNAMRRQQQQQVMPMSPTDPGAMGQGGMGQAGMGQAGGQGYGPTPSLPGQGIAQGGSQGYTPNGPAPYDPNRANTAFSKPVTGNYGGYGTQLSAPRASYLPTAGDTMSGIMNTANMSNIGVPTNPLNSGAAQKPYSDYQRPNGYSPWMRLYDTPTNNGTVSPYTSAVQPAFQQQQYNQQLSEQIQGVRSSMGPRGGTPGMEMPVNGAGLYNPYGSINYINPMGR